MFSSTMEERIKGKKTDTRLSVLLIYLYLSEQEESADQIAISFAVLPRHADGVTASGIPAEL